MRPLLILTLLAATASSNAFAAPDGKAAEARKPAAKAGKNAPVPAAPVPGRPLPADGAGMPDALKKHDHGDEKRSEAKPFGLGESNVEYFWRKADVAFHAGDYPRTIALHKAIVALDPTEIESYSAASWLMWSLGNGDEALAFLQRGIDANPGDWDMYDTAGSQYDLQKEYAMAKEAFAKAVSLIPAGEDSQMLRRRLAHAAEHAGDLKLAAATWRDLVRDYPNDAVNKNNLARVDKLSGLRNVNYNPWLGTGPAALAAQFGLRWGFSLRKS